VGQGEAGAGNRPNRGTTLQNRNPGTTLQDRNPGRNGQNRDLGNSLQNRDLGNNLQNRDLGNTLQNRNISTRNFNTSIGSNWNRDVNINAFNLSPGWARPGWGYARPWSYGWYGGWAAPRWGWWGASAAVWGVTSLASAVIINAAVDAAVSNNTTYIVVPETTYQLLYGTVQPSGSQGVTFLVQIDGSTYNLSADCNAGTIDGTPPKDAAQAELLNAACQVAYGST